LDVENLPLSSLEAACRRETRQHLRGAPSDGRYCLEIIRRAMLRSVEHSDTRAPYSDSVAQEAFVQIYTEFIKANINRAALYKVSIDDLVQQVWLRFWQAAGSEEGLTFTSLEKALGYLKLTTVTAIFEYRRRTRDEWRLSSLDQLAQDSDDEEAHAKSADPFSAYIRQRFRERVRELLIDPLKYRIFWMRYGLMMKPSEVASLLRHEGITMRGRSVTARMVSDELERLFKQLKDDSEIRDLLQSD